MQKVASRAIFAYDKATSSEDWWLRQRRDGTWLDLSAPQRGGNRRDGGLAVESQFAQAIRVLAPEQRFGAARIAEIAADVLVQRLSGAETSWPEAFRREVLAERAGRSFVRGQRWLRW